MHAKDSASIKSVATRLELCVEVDWEKRSVQILPDVFPSAGIDWLAASGDFRRFAQWLDSLRLSVRAEISSVKSVLKAGDKKAGAADGDKGRESASGKGKGNDARANAAAAAVRFSKRFTTLEPAEGMKSFAIWLAMTRSSTLWRRCVLKNVRLAFKGELLPFGGVLLSEGFFSALIANKVAQITKDERLSVDVAASYAAAVAGTDAPLCNIRIKVSEIEEAEELSTGGLSEWLSELESWYGRARPTEDNAENTPDRPGAEEDSSSRARHDIDAYMCDTSVCSESCSASYDSDNNEQEYEQE